MWLRRLVVAFPIIVASIGCQMPGKKQEVRHVDPALPMSMNRVELVDYLNKQNHTLNGWQCASTRMQVKLPNGMVGRLKGAIACQAPQYFRLTASNSVARADLGSNASRCWFYSKPGEGSLITWRHEDTALVQQVPMGIPYIDPNWLMLVMGISPLNADDYELSHGPDGSRELWLTAIEPGPNGRSLRRVIKIDTMRGVIHEHSVYDSEANPVVKAILSDHKSHNGNLIPQVVKLQFPQLDSEMRLTFGDIDTNPNLPDALWRVPDHNVKVVDLGEFIRNQMMPHQPPTQVAQNNARFVPPRAALRAPAFADHGVQTAAAEPASSTVDSAFFAQQFGEPAADTATPDKAASKSAASGMTAPEWDSPASVSPSKARNVSYEGVDAKPQPKRGLGSFWPR